MFKYKSQLVVLLLLVTAALGMTRVVAQETFFGKTADELFPDSPTETEKELAFKALLAAEIPDGHALGEGKTITVGTLGQGARGGISGTLYFWRPAFEAATGATLEIVEIPYGQLGTTIPADFLTGQYTYDAFVAAAWQYGDWVSNEWIQPIDKYLGDPRFAQWSPDDTGAPFRALLQWGGQTYGTQMDGDQQILYYRNDILTDPTWQEAFKAETGKDMVVPPQTWQQLYDITNFFNGKDWNADGDPDDGISLHLKAGGQGHWHFGTLAASFAVTPASGDDARKVTKYDNVFYFDPDTMEPLINQPGQVMALEFLQKLAKTGPDAQYGWELGEAWDNFLGGNAIATFSSGATRVHQENTDRSKIKGNLGAAVICSDTWWCMTVKKAMSMTEANPNCALQYNWWFWRHPVLSASAMNRILTYFFMAMIADPVINFYDPTTAGRWY
ncbi:MAG: extracellular solute-binding protein [Anaerolineae bacterium]